MKKICLAVLLSIFLGTTISYANTLQTYGSYSELYSDLQVGDCMCRPLTHMNDSCISVSNLYSTSDALLSMAPLVTIRGSYYDTQVECCHAQGMMNNVNVGNMFWRCYHTTGIVSFIAAEGSCDLSYVNGNPDGRPTDICLP